MIPLSILDLAPVAEGSAPADTFAHMLDLARLGEALGYRRYWLAEHHNMPGIASAATAVLIAHVAAATRTIRVGAQNRGQSRLFQENRGQSRLFQRSGRLRLAGVKNRL
jgi:hypothetical protein